MGRRSWRWFSSWRGHLALVLRRRRARRRRSKQGQDGLATQGRDTLATGNMPASGRLGSFCTFAPRPPSPRPRPGWPNWVRFARLRHASRPSSLVPPGPAGNWVRFARIGSQVPGRLRREIGFVSHISPSADAADPPGESSRRGGYPPRPSRTRTCGFPASGSSSGRFAPEYPRQRRRSGPSGPQTRRRGCWTRIAIRRSFVDTVSGCRVPGVFPVDGSTMWCLLPSPGSPWVGCPKFGGTIRHYDFPVPVPSDLWIRRSAPAPALVFARSGTRTLPAAWLLCFRSGAVRPWFSTGNTGTSQVPGMPLLCLCPAL